MIGGNRHIAQVRATRLYEAESSPALIAARFGLDPSGIIDFSLNINPFGPPRSSMAAGADAMARCNEYPDLRLSELRRRLGERHGVPPEALLFGAGLDDVIKLLIHAWTAEGDRVLIHVPTFPRYALESSARGAVPVLVRSDPPWRIDVQRLRHELSRADVALAFLCTPNNPTGAVIPLADIAWLSADFPETRFVVDEALVNPLDAGAVALTLARRNVAVLRTFSKYFGLAGHRVGYAVADPELLEVAEVVRPPFNVSLVSAAAVLAALDDSAFIEDTRRTFEAEMEAFTRALSRLPHCRILGRHSNMLLLGLDRVRSEAFAEALAQRGLIVADGKSFHGLEEHDTVRVSLRDRAANTRLLAAMEMVL